MSSATQAHQRQTCARATGRLAGGVLALGMLSWVACSPDGMEYSSDAVRATRAGLVTDNPPRPASLADLVPDAPRVALPVPAAEDVGTVAGAAGVEGGAATYTIDIPVPPGRRGMQPDVALTYSSRTGSGIAGVGWSLAATSSIHRCPRTVAQDGETRGVDFSMHDRLCLDGQRLIVVRGGYGQPDSEYRTEIDTFARITLQNDSMAREYSYFRVEHKSGQIAYYGFGPVTSRNAVHVPPGARAPLAWKLWRVEDGQRNSIIYRYGAAETGHLLHEIRYTGTGARPGDRRVRFFYDHRVPDVAHGYRAGARSLLPQRLSEIRTYIDEQTLVRRYVLEYRTSQASGRSLLARIAACAEPCQAPDRTPWTRFVYAEEDIEFAAEPLAGAAGEHQSARLLGDYDGDGTRDLLRLTHPPIGGGPLEQWLHLSSRAAPIDLSDGPWLTDFDRATAGYPSDRDTDFDRDGLADLVGEIDGKLAIAAWNGARLVPTTSNLPLPRSAGPITPVDLDADGDVDVLVRYREALMLHRNCTPRRRGQDREPLQFCDSIRVATFGDREALQHVADVDGNGLPDLYLDWNGRLDPRPARIVFTYQNRDGLFFRSHTIEALGGPAHIRGDRGGTRWLDVNGDDLLDLFRLPDQLWLNTGRGFARAADLRGAIEIPRALYDAALVMDVGADGRAALLVPAELVHPWCYLTVPATEPRTYCGADLLGSEVSHLDRSIYRWDAVHVRFDARGRPRLVRVPTAITAPVRASHVEDFHGDGLPDVRYRLTRMYGETDVGPVVVGYYAPSASPPPPLGSYVVRNLGPDGWRRHQNLPDLLQYVRDGLGREHIFAHVPLSSAGVFACPVSAERPFYRVDRAAAAPHHYHFTSSMHVVARFVAPSGTGAIHDTCYRYEDAMQSDEGRGFQGFRAIVAEQALAEDAEDNLRTTTRYHDAFPLTGRVRSIQVHLASDAADAAPLRETTMQWNARCAEGICFPHVTEQIDRTYDLATRAVLGTTTTRTTYEARDVRHGNPTRIEVTTDDAFATRVQRTELAYDYGDVDAWWLGKRVRQTVVDAPVVYEQGPVPEAADNAGKRVVTEFAWFADDHPGRRLLQRETVQPDVAHQEQQTTYEYDAHGNPVRAWVRASFDSGARETTWTYTPDGTFVATETNAAGHVRTLTYDPGTGNLLTEERYGITTRYDYDGLGRLRTTRTASATRDLPPVHVRRLWCDDACPPHALFRQVTVQDGAPIERVYIDALGRIIRTEASGFGDRGDIVEVAVYDAHGRLVRRSPPSYVAAGAYFTEYGAHDALGRPGYMTQDRSGHVHRTATTHYRYDGATTHIERPGGLIETRTHDSAGQLVGSVDAAGSATHLRHDAHGNVILIEDSAGNRITAGHDDRGRRLRLTDPDSGTRAFTWNGLGELVAQTDANGHAVHFRYDPLGRLTERWIDGAPEARWDYDGARPGVLDAVHGPDGYQRSYSYDDLLRPTRIITQVTGQLRFAHDTAYDTYYGRAKAVMYPDDEIVALAYDAHGYSAGEHNPRLPGETYRRIVARTARGQIAREHFGNGLVAYADRVPSTGAIVRLFVLPARAWDRADADVRARAHAPVDAAMVQDLWYGYDPHGNLTSRRDDITGVAETLGYDALHRLAQVQRTWERGHAPIAIDYGYDARGNLTRKSDFAARYDYGDAARANAANAGPHAVRAVTLPDDRTLDDFAYDAAGNMVAGNGRIVHYDARGQVEELVGEDGETTRFAYAPDGARYMQAQGGKTTFYIGGDFEYIVNADGTIEKRSFIEDYAVIERVDGQRRVRYLHPDRHGSITAITDEEGAVVERHGYDAFGQPLTSEWRDSDGRLHGSEYAAETTTRGFTGHEHLDAHRLIHMGGRVFDPRLARFLSVDPVIVDVASSQALNPYSYVRNRPFAAVDPSGFGECPWVNGRFVCQGPEKPGTVEGTYQIPIDASGNGKQGQGVDTPSHGPAVSTNAVARAIEGVGHAGQFLAGVVKGFVAGGVDAVAGLAHVALHPVQTGQGLAHAVRHPVITAGAAWGSIQDTARAMAAGDPHAWGQGGFELAAVLLGASITRLDKLADAARVAARGGGRLRSVGSGVWESSTGLRYGQGSAQGNRVRHVLEHAVDSPTRSGQHGVFAGSRSSVIGTIDEAYGFVRAGSPGINVVQQGSRTVYTIHMGRTVGYVGGRAGASLGNPAASHVRLILQGREVITAFPVIP